MWIVDHGKLISLQKISSSYIHKDRLLSIDTKGICQSIEIFCPCNTKVVKLPWNKFWTIDTKDWVLKIIKLDAITMTLSSPIVLANIATVEELYQAINKSDRYNLDSSKTTKIEEIPPLSKLDTDYSC